MNGFQNEYKFVLEINNKLVKELNPILYDLVFSIFNNISDDDLIKSWCNHYNQKTDIFIKIGNAMKGISIKMGSRNSVHVESIDSFIAFLKGHKIPENIINEYLKFHYADGTTNNTGINRISSEEYKIDNQKSIDIINNYFNDKEIIRDAIDRFVLMGNNSSYAVDAIIYGTPEDFLWITRNDIIDILTSSNKYVSSPHFGELICQPMNRCINHNSKYEKYRKFVQIKWYSLFDNIIDQMNKNVIREFNYSRTSN